MMSGPFDDSVGPIVDVNVDLASTGDESKRSRNIDEKAWLFLALFASCCSFLIAVDATSYLHVSTKLLHQETASSLHLLVAMSNLGAC